MIWVLMLLNLSPLWAEWADSVTRRDSSALDILERFDIDRAEFRRWAQEASKGRIHELTQDTVIYNRNDDDDFYYAEVEDPKLKDLRDDPQGYFRSLFQAHMEDHWNYKPYGSGNFYGTGVYAHTDPFGASTRYGHNFLTITLPKGSRVLLDRYEEIPMTLPGCEDHNYLESMMRDTSMCRALAKAMLRALKVTAIAYNYGNRTLECTKKYALILVDDLEIDPQKVGGHFENNLPDHLKLWNSSKLELIRKATAATTLGCGPKLKLIEPTLDLHYPEPPTTPCVHSGTSPLNKDLLGTLSSMLGGLR